MFNLKSLIELYVQFNVPCDKLVSDPALLIHFTKVYTAKTGHSVNPAELSQKLLNLRKKGYDKGGLPRLNRKYCGRGTSKDVA